MPCHVSHPNTEIAMCLTKPACYSHAAMMHCEHKRAKARNGDKLLNKLQESADSTLCKIVPTAIKQTN